MIVLSLGSRPQFSGHETFPLRQLWLRKAWRAVTPPFSQRDQPFAAEDAVVDFGVGKNMVSAIRFWATACHVIGEREDKYVGLPLGNALFGSPGLDGYCEHPATPWLIHWRLSSTCDKTATWYFLFNHMLQPTFDRDMVVALVQECIDELEHRVPGLKRVSASTIKRDVDCCIRSYVPRASGESAEEMSEPLLGELGLLQQHSRSGFEFRRGPKRSLPDGIFAYALLDYWQRQGAGAVMAFDRIAHDYGSPGRVFKLSEEAVADRLMALDDLTRGQLQWVEQAGIRQVSRRGGALNDIDSAMLGALEKAYAKT
jgi:Protein of unknown function (DUF4007)